MILNVIFILLLQTKISNLIPKGLVILNTNFVVNMEFKIPKPMKVWSALFWSSMKLAPRYHITSLQSSIY